MLEKKVHSFTILQIMLQSMIVLMSFLHVEHHQLWQMIKKKLLKLLRFVQDLILILEHLICVRLNQWSLHGKKLMNFINPVVLDPVGVGAPTLRTQTALKLLKEIQFSVIRGNISEIKTLALGSGTTKGVDANLADKVTAENIHEVVSFAQEFSKKTGAVIAITGAIDLVCNENIAYAIYNGHEMMSSITGTGCQLSALTASFVSANPDYLLEATVAAVCTMGLAGEQHMKDYSVRW